MNILALQILFYLFIKDVRKVYKTKTNIGGCSTSCGAFDYVIFSK